MTIRHYLLHGMPVRSEVALPETEQAQPFASSGGELRIVLGPAEVSAPDFPEGVREILRVSSGDRVMQIGGVTRTSSWLLRWPEVLELRLDPSATVLTAVPDPRADAGFLPILLGASALAFVLTVRQHLVLHGSCVAIDDEATVIVADSGGGKSTLSALLCAAGAKFVSDDVVRVDLGSVPTVHRGSRELRLRPTNPEVAELLSAHPSRVTADDRTAVQVPGFEEATLPLRRVVLPVLHPSLDAAYSEAVSPPEALLLLLGKLRVPGVRDAAFHEPQFTQLAELVQTVEIRRLHLPWTRPFTREIAASYVDAITE